MHSCVWRTSMTNLAWYCGLALALALGGCKADSGRVAGSAAAPLTISGTPATLVDVGQTYTFQPTASGPASGTSSFSIQNKPAWATLNTATGQLSGTPRASDAGTYANIVIAVSDDTTSAALQPFAIAVVSAVAGSATVLWTPPTQNQDGSALTNLAGFRIYYGKGPNALTQMTSLAGPALNSHEFNNLASGTWYFAVAAYTGEGVESELSDVVSKTI